MSLSLCEDDEKCTRIVNTLKAVAHPVRLRIIAILSRQSEHVTGLTQQLQVNQAIVSQQLRILRMAGLVDANRKDGFAYYYLLEKNLSHLIDCVENMCST